MLKLGPETLMH